MATKVKVNFKHPTVMMTQEKYDSYMKEYEKLLQENKDLRVQVGHLRDDLAKSESESSQGMNAMAKFWEEAVNEKNKAEERAEEYHVALMESDCRVAELEKRMDWLSKEVMEWKATAEGYKNQYEELKAQKEADDKKCEETCADCNERYEDVLADRNHLRERIAKYEKSVTFAKMEEAMLTISRLREEVEILTDERDTAVDKNTEMMFDINELQDKWEAEHNLRVEAEKAYDQVASEAYDMHQQITNLIIDNTRLENKVEELSELEADYDALVQTKREYGEEIDRLRKVVTSLQSTRFTTDEFLRMIARELMPSTGNGFADSLDF